jgi:hypothetical protein
MLSSNTTTSSFARMLAENTSLWRIEMKKLMSTLALLMAMATPAFAQSFNPSYDNYPAYSQQQGPKDHATDVGSGGGGA